MLSPEVIFKFHNPKILLLAKVLEKLTSVPGTSLKLLVLATFVLPNADIIFVSDFTILPWKSKLNFNLVIALLFPYLIPNNFLLDHQQYHHYQNKI